MRLTSRQVRELALATGHDERGFYALVQHDGSLIEVRPYVVGAMLMWRAS